MENSSSTMSQPKEGLFRQILEFKRAFWMVNIMEMLERLAYYRALADRYMRRTFKAARTPRQLCGAAG